MPDTAVVGNIPFLRHTHGMKILEYYTNSAATSSTTVAKREWMLGGYYRIVDLIANAETIATGPGNTILDVLLNGTSVFTAAADRLTLASSNTGKFTRGSIATTSIEPEDILELYVDAIPTTGAGRLMFVAILVPA